MGSTSDSLTLFLCGDVMTGRGIDQILPHPNDPVLYEPAVRSAHAYVELAERPDQPIPRSAPFCYVWGDALEELRRVSPDLTIVNLETAVTTCPDYCRTKQVHYRMHPRNTPVLTAGGIDGCVLANNHVLDWGYAGLEETLATLQSAGIATIGAGRNLREAQQPAEWEFAGGAQARTRVLVFAFGSVSSGIPFDWGARDDKPGVNLFDETSRDAAARVRALVEQFKRPGDVVVVSIHWGPNWGYEVAAEQRLLAHDLIDRAGVDVVHGHSSHHVKGLEVHRNRPILYGCGDFLTDYEGICGYEAFRPELGLMYFLNINRATGELRELRMKPTRMKRFQVTLAPSADAAWLAEMLNREGRNLGTRVERAERGELIARWD